MFGDTWSAIRGMVKNEVLQTPTARAIMRKSGFSAGGATSSAQTPVLSLNGSRRVCFTPDTVFSMSSSNWAINTSGKLYGWGLNAADTFALGSNSVFDTARISQLSSPTQIHPELTGQIEKVGPGLYPVLLKNDSTILTTGPPQPSLDFGGALAPEAGITGVVDVRANDSNQYLLLGDGTIWGRGVALPGMGVFPNSYDPAYAWSTDIDEFQQMPTAKIGSGVVEISTIPPYLDWRLADGTVRRWLNGAEFPIEPSGVPSGVVKIASGFTHFAILTSSGDIWVAGANDHGQAGLGFFDAGGYSSWRQTLGTLYTDVAASPITTYGLKDGSIYSWGTTGELLGRGPLAADTHTPTQITDPPIDDYTALYSSEYSPMAIRASGCIHTWGRNFGGVLGQGYAGFNIITHLGLLYEPTEVGVSTGFPQFPLA